MYGFGVYNGGLKKVIKTLQLDKNRKLKFEERFTNIIYGRTNTISIWENKYNLSLPSHLVGKGPIYTS